MPTSSPQRPVHPTARRALPFVAAVLTLLLSFALRTHRLGAKSIWWDEAHSWWYAHLPLAQGIREGMANWHGAAGDPLFTVILHAWIVIVGDSAFAMRFLSTLISVLTVAYLGRVTARAFGRQVGQVALLVGAIAPIWVFYAQEVRQYALTPAIMLIMVEAVIHIARGNLSAASWVQLAVGETLALYAHSFMVFGVAVINLWLGWLWLRQLGGGDKQRWLRNWIVSQVATLVLVIPTLPAYFQRVQAGHSPFVQPLSVPHILNAQWSLFMGIPWEHATDALALRLFAGATLALLLPGLVLALPRAGSRLLADLVWFIAITDGLTVIYWTINPVVHPRYELFLTGPLFAVLSLLLVRGWGHGRWGRAFSSLMALSLILASLFSINNLYIGQMLGYRHDPAQSVAGILQDQFGPQDGIISIDPNDFTLSYYGVGEAALFRAGLDEGYHTPADLLAFIQGKERVGVVHFHAERSDQRGIIPFYLERFGTRTGSQWLPSYAIYTYKMTPDVIPKPVTFEPTFHQWGPLILVGQSIQSGEAVTLALEWEAAPGLTTGVRYASIVRLTDPETGWVLGTASELILSDEGNPTSDWQPGERATQYLVIPLYPGTPPIETELTVALVNSSTGQALDVRDISGAPAGQQVSLGRIVLGEAPERWVYDQPPPFTFASPGSDVLAGYTTDWPTTAPGGTVGVTLNWRATPQDVEANSARLELVQEGRVLASDGGPPLQGRTPASLSSSQTWLDRRVLQVSGESKPGDANLIMVWGDERILLGEIEVFAFQRLTQRPVVENPLETTFGGTIQLLGYRLDAPQPITSASTVVLTLYWEALANGSPGGDYVVFAQLLDSHGRLVGQHDGVPVYGTRPTSGWLRGEYLIDEHPMTFREPYTGPVRIQVGLYNPASLERLGTGDGSDAVLLPPELMVENGN